MRCGRTISVYIPMISGIHPRSVLAPTLCKNCMDHVVVMMSEDSGCAMQFGAVRITDLDFSDDVVILTEITEVLSVASESLRERKQKR